MHRTHRYISTLFLAAALATPVAILAAEPQNASLQVRVYDRDHKDYHNWDDNEARSYTTFRADHPKYNATFTKTNRKQQSDYWGWRHSHPDNK
jgi:proteasome lid subunit RPN8/RPN11